MPMFENPEQEKLYEKLLSLDPWNKAKRITYTPDDTGTAYLLADMYDSTIRYCLDTDIWYVWVGYVWKKAEPIEISSMAQTVFNLMYLYFMNLPKEDKEAEEEYYKLWWKQVKKVRNATTPKQIIDNLLKTNLVVRANELDNDPYLLNTPSCTYDLRTGKLIAHEDIKEKMVTKCTPVDVLEVDEEPEERWETFISEIMSFDEDKITFLQKALGYSILGTNRDECMFVAYGKSTRNGKGTLFSAIVGALGSDYADSTSPKLICETKGGVVPDLNAPQPALTKLVGTRIVTMSEAQDRERINAAAMKAMTGRDILTTRGLYEKPFSFIPQFTIWLNTNWLPPVSDETVFTSDRIWVITFDEHFDRNRQDRDLKELFATPKAKSTILSWLFEGCRMYMKEEHLQIPECVQIATEEYHRKFDKIGSFLAECVIKVERSRVTKADLFKAYTRWCSDESNRYNPGSAMMFHLDMERRGFYTGRYNGYPTYKGIRLINPDEKNSGKIRLTPMKGGSTDEG